MFIIAVLWTAFFVINFNIAMMIPLLPFMQRELGLSPGASGVVLAAFPVAALFGNLGLGPLIDRFGRRRFIVTGASGCAVLFLATAASRSALAVALCRAATGGFMPMIGASIFAAVADYFPPQDRSRVTGYVTSAAPIAFLCSMSMGVWLGGLVAWQVPVIVFALLALGLAGCAARLPPTPAEGLSTAPISVATYRNRLFSISMNRATRRLLIAYLCWSAAVFAFLGLYPTWLVQHGLAGDGAGVIGTMLLIGEVGGLAGAVLSGRLSRIFAHPLLVCALAAFGTAAVVLVIPAGGGMVVVQAGAYGVFAFGRDLMLALILGGAMSLVAAAQRGSLNAVMNALYQTGATFGGMASAWLYALRPDFGANAAAACVLFCAAGLLLWSIARIRATAEGGAMRGGC